MKIAKLITPYGIIKNPPEIIAEMVMIQPFNAKAVIDKTLEKSIQYIRENDIKVVPNTCKKINIKA